MGIYLTLFPNVSLSGIEDFRDYVAGAVLLFWLCSFVRPVGCDFSGRYRRVYLVSLITEFPIAEIRVLQKGFYLGVIQNTSLL